ncbi:unnamed protein product, partial [Prorocentrum cordatum]
ARPNPPVAPPLPSSLPPLRRAGCWRGPRLLGPHSPRGGPPPEGHGAPLEAVVPRSAAAAAARASGEGTPGSCPVLGTQCRSAGAAAGEPLALGSRSEGQGFEVRWDGRLLADAGILDCEGTGQQHLEEHAPIANADED